MTEPSEAEVEAAARAIWDVYYGTPEIFDRCLARGAGDTGETKFMFEKSMSGARAALTAAAQVRGRVREADENSIASPAQERDFAAYVESVARALHEAHMPYCDYTYPFDHPMSSSDMYRALARAVTLVRGQLVQAPVEPAEASRDHYVRRYSGMGGEEDDLANSSEQPTCDMRWVSRSGHEPHGFSESRLPPVITNVLQQRWQITDYRGFRQISRRDEWRDVPTATA